MNLENDFAKLGELLEARDEWLLARPNGKSFALRASEIEIELTQNKILFSFLDERGFQTWRVAAFETSRDEILLDLTRNFEREREKIRLIRRAAAAELTAAVELARLEKADEIARLIVAETRGAKLIKVGLNVENGRFAQIVFEPARGKRIAAIADVSGAALTHENLLAFAVSWLSSLQARKKEPIEIVWILADARLTKNLQKLRALLRTNWQNAIEIFEISRSDAAAQNVDKEKQSLKKLESIDFSGLWRAKSKKINSLESLEISRTAKEIASAAPEKIDAAFTKHGETLKFLGLPFARVRKISGAETVWFGVGNRRRILTENNLAEFSDLIEQLETNRRFDAENKQSALYRLASEAWLEAVLRRNVKRLDANLILSPVYNQFRSGAGDRIDLLALRRDGRLVVVELKAAPDREMIFQAADYWRKIEAARRAGNLKAAKLFGDLEIAAAPPLVYLVAPLLSFHRDFDFFAQMMSKKIEIYRFDLNENWREDLKVIRRDKN